MTRIDVVHAPVPDDHQLAAAHGLTGTDIDVLRRRLGSPRRALLLAFAAGRPVGAALLTTRADADIELYPGDGAGGALIAAAVGALPGSTLLSARAVVGSPAETALRAAGFRQRASESLMECRLDDLTDAEVPPGYGIHVSGGPPPEHWWTGLVRVKQAVRELADSPRTEVVLDLLRGQYELMARLGTVHTAVAEIDGEVAGFSDVVVPPGSGPATQLGTGVLPEHRGRRLSAALKAATARTVRAHHPDVTSVETTIDDTNVPMSAVSRRLGFRTVRRTGSWTLSL